MEFTEMVKCWNNSLRPKVLQFANAVEPAGAGPVLKNAACRAKRSDCGDRVPVPKVVAVFDDVNSSNKRRKADVHFRSRFCNRQWNRLILSSGTDGGKRTL